MSIGVYAKAVVGALVAGVGALVAALDDDVVTRAEWATVALAFLVALGAIWAVPNARVSDQ